jgi:hypothetical protein
MLQRSTDNRTSPILMQSPLQTTWRRLTNVLIAKARIERWTESPVPGESPANRQLLLDQEAHAPTLKKANRSVR